jgi:Uncharacterized protein conserved in bacteria
MINFTGLTMAYVPIAFLLVLLVVFSLCYKLFFVRVRHPFIMIVKTLGLGRRVAWDGAFVMPLIQKVELLKTALVNVEVDRRGAGGFRCRDDLRVDLALSFYLSIGLDDRDIISVVKKFGLDMARATEPIAASFRPELEEAVSAVCREYEMEYIFDNRLVFLARLKKVIKADIDFQGFIFEDAVIDYLDQTPVNYLDPRDPADARAIEKLREIAAMSI